MTASLRPMKVLGIHPMDRGFGWIVFAGRTEAVDWGYVDERHPGKNTRCVTRFERLVDQYRPQRIVLEQFEGEATRRAPRVRRLCESILNCARRRRIRFCIVSRAQVHTAFASHGAISRHEIAKAIAARIEPLAHRLPDKRKPWLNEDPNIALFSAAAVALTYYARRRTPAR